MEFMYDKAQPLSTHLKVFEIGFSLASNHGEKRNIGINNNLFIFPFLYF